MALVFYNGTILFSGGLPAMSTNCCCTGCPCPGPTRIRCEFEQVSGTPCEGIAVVCGEPLDGLVVYLDAVPLDPGQECNTQYNMSCDGPPECCVAGHLVVNIGEVQLELRCVDGDHYELASLVGSGGGEWYLFNPTSMDNTDNKATQISGTNDPWQYVFEFAADEFSMCGTETGITPIFRLTLTDASP